jgi:transposase
MHSPLRRPVRQNVSLPLVLREPAHTKQAYHGISLFTVIPSLRSRSLIAYRVISTVKSDSLDAEGAARRVLNGQATAKPKTGAGTVEMIRHLEIARDTSVKCRPQAMLTLKTLIINAPAILRDVLDRVSDKVVLIRHMAALRPSAIISTIASAKAAMSALAKRWLMINNEIKSHDKELEKLIAIKAPELITSHGIATVTAAKMFILVGDEQTRIHSEAALRQTLRCLPDPSLQRQNKPF